MKWSPQQDLALRRVAAWLKDPHQQVFYLAGWAGTGKTTLAKHFAESVEGTVLYGAYTGKAAYVLRQKGCTGATTIHSLIYIGGNRSKVKLAELNEALATLLAELSMEYGTEFNVEEHPKVKELREKIAAEEDLVKAPVFTLNPDSEVKNAGCVIIDEISMVDMKVGTDLLSYGVKVLVLGDPAQLPPVYGSGYFTNREPDFTLTEIHRQAQESPVLWIAHKVREGRSVPLGKYGDSRVVEKVGVEDVLLHDQMIVGKNDTRKDSNVKMRKLTLLSGKEYRAHPVTGDRLVCLRNNHERGLLNGAIWYVDEAGEAIDEQIGLWLRPDDDATRRTLVSAHVHYFEKRGEKLPWWTKKDAEEFDYGYALTAHKSQGSQWNSVLVFDESWVFKENRHRWLYTAVTRAAERVTIVRT